MSFSAIIATPLGNLRLIATDTALTACHWSTEALHFNHDSALLKMASEQLQAYFQKKLTRFDLPLYHPGTDFQQQVWASLLTIPYGETCSYQDIANRIENPKAVRAVGMANSRNQLCIIIPCHRVIYASQKIGGYSGGIDYKEKLLALENPKKSKNLIQPTIQRELLKK